MLFRSERTTVWYLHKICMMLRQWRSMFLLLQATNTRTDSRLQNRNSKLPSPHQHTTDLRTALGLSEEPQAYMLGSESGKAMEQARVKQRRALKEAPLAPKWDEEKAFQMEAAKLWLPSETLPEQHSAQESAQCSSSPTAVSRLHPGLTT